MKEESRAPINNWNIFSYKCFANQKTLSNIIYSRKHLFHEKKRKEKESGLAYTLFLPKQKLLMRLNDNIIFNTISQVINDIILSKTILLVTKDH